MRQKTSYFNKNLFLHTFLRFWPVWAAYFLVWLFMLLSVPDTMDWNQPERQLEFVVYELPRTLYELGIYMSFVFGAFAAMAVFSHLYSIRSAGAFGSLPLRRECVFLTQTASGLAGFLLVDLIALLLFLAVLSAYGYFSVFLPIAAQLLAQLFTLNFFFFAFAVLCAQLTGHLLVLPAVYAVLNFTAYVVEALVQELLRLIVYGFWGTGDPVLRFLSPFVEFQAGTRWYAVYTDDYSRFLHAEFIGWGTLAAYAAAGVLLLGLALWLCRRRRMESAGDVVAVRPLRPVFKYCMTVGCALVFCILVLNTFFYTGGMTGTALLSRVLIFMFIGAALGFAIAQMLLEKSFRALRHGWGGFLAAYALLAAFTCAFDYDLFGLEKSLPEAGEVREVNISVYGNSATFTSPEGIADCIALQSSVVAGKKQHEDAQAANESGSYISFYYYGEDDESLMRRRYVIADESADMSAAGALLNCLEAIGHRHGVSFPPTEENLDVARISWYSTELGGYTETKLSPEEAVEFYEDCIFPDLREGLLGQVWFRTDQTYLDEVCALDIRIEWSRRIAQDQYESEIISVTPSLSARRTISWLRAYGIPVLTRGEVEELQKDPYRDPHKPYVSAAYDGPAGYSYATEQAIG